MYNRSIGLDRPVLMLGIEVVRRQCADDRMLRAD